jgi:hypothetical protein
MARSYPKPLVEEPFTKKEKKGNKKNKAPVPRKKRIPKVPHRYNRGIHQVSKIISKFQELGGEVPVYLTRKLASLQLSLEMRKAKIYNYSR